MIDVAESSFSQSGFTANKWCAAGLEHEPFMRSLGASFSNYSMNSCIEKMTFPGSEKLINIPR